MTIAWLGLVTASGHKVPNVRVRVGSKIVLAANIITQAGLDWLTDFVACLNPPVISRFAVGVGEDEPNLGDVKLGDEQFRKEFTNAWREPGLAVIETYFARNEANFHWRELGLIAGGTEEPDTGILVARVLVDVNKTEFDSTVVTWELGVSNA